MRTDSLVDRLAQNLRPVRPRRIKREALLLLLFGAVEIAAFLAMGFMRPDMPVAMEAPSFWWKLTSMGLIAFLGAGVALLSTDRCGRHARDSAGSWSARRDLCQRLDHRREGDGVPDLVRRLDWTQGLQCVWKTVVLSIPPVIALGGLIRRGAPTDRSGTALAAGLSSAAWGAFVFVFACPSDDPLYIAVWYTVGCSIVTVLGRAILMRLSRW